MTSPLSSSLLSASNPLTSASQFNTNSTTAAAGTGTGAPVKGNETFEKNFGAIFQMNMELFKNQALSAFGNEDNPFGSNGGGQQNSIGDLATKLFPSASTAGNSSATGQLTLGQVMGQMIGMTVPYETFNDKLGQLAQKTGKVVGVFERDGTYFLKLEDGTSLPAVFRSADPASQVAPAA